MYVQQTSVFTKENSNESIVGICLVLLKFHDQSPKLAS